MYYVFVEKEKYIMQKFISSSVTKNFEDAVKLAADLNCNLEISRFAQNLDDIDSTFTKRIEAMKKALFYFKGETSLHGFLFDLSVVSLDPLIKEVSIKRFQQSLDAAKYLGAKTVVYHTGFNAYLNHSMYRLMFKEKFTAFWKTFVKQFEYTGITAVLENVQEKTPEFILDVVKEVNSPNLKVSLDIGHVNIHSKVPVVDWIQSYNKYLYHMHLHNNYGKDDSHNTILKGTINVQEVFQTIKNLNLNPKMVFEIFDKNELKESLQFFDDYFMQDKIRK